MRVSKWGKRVSEERKGEGRGRADVRIREISLQERQKLLRAQKKKGSSMKATPIERGSQRWSPKKNE